MKHILFTLKGCPLFLLDDEPLIRTMLANAASIAQAELLDIVSHKFSPLGVTAVALLAESHISIHTWPEKNMAVCDVFTCGTRAVPEYAVTYITEYLEASEIIHSQFIRPLDQDPNGHQDS